MKSAEIWVELGNTNKDLGFLDKAVDAYQKAIDQKMQSGWLYNNLASIYVQQGNYLGAIPLYQKSLELFTNPKDLATVWGQIGNVYHRLFEYGKAIQAFQKVDEIMPRQSKDKNSYIILADKTKAEIEGDFIEGQDLQAIEDGWQVDDILPNSLAENNETFELANDIESSAPEISEAENNEENQSIEKDAKVWNELGLILFKVGAYDDAIDAYKKAISLEPAIGYLYSNLGQVFIIQGKLPEAIEQYEKSIKLFSNNKDKAISWTRLGDIYRQLGQYENALPAYQLADVLSQTTVVYSNEYCQVKLDSIITNHEQVRGLDDIGDLVMSIRLYGIIQPLIVCPGKNNPGKYTLIAGRRRLVAARQAGLKEVPVIVRRATNQEIIELSINENIHNIAVNSFELAKEYQRLANDFDLSLEEISSRVGRSLHSVANTMKMLENPRKGKQTTLTEELLPGQEVINRSLAELHSEYPVSQYNFEDDDLPICDVNTETESNFTNSANIPEVDASPTLWYLDTENEVALTRQEDEFCPETSSLLTRARRVLKSNPHAKRLWTTSPYRA